MARAISIDIQFIIVLARDLQTVVNGNSGVSVYPDVLKRKVDCRSEIEAKNYQNYDCGAKNIDLLYLYYMLSFHYHLTTVIRQLINLSAISANNRQISVAVVSKTTVISQCEH